MERTKIQNDQMFMLENEIYANSIIPSRKNEMWRKIELHGDVEIKGGIFGKSLNVNAGNIFIKEAVYCKENMQIKTQQKGKLWFNSVVNAEHSILVEHGGRTRFSTDLRSKKIKLNNSVVYGNVYCDELIAMNSVILGQVFANKKLSVANSILGSFHAGSFLLKRNMGLLLPYSVSHTPPRFEGKVYNILSAEKSEKAYELGVQDIFEYHGLQGDSSQDVYVITPSMRIFDLSAFYASIEKTLKQIVYFSHYQSTDYLKTDVELAKFERLFFKYLYNKFEIQPGTPLSRFMTLEDEAVADFIPVYAKEETNISDYPENIPRNPVDTNLSQEEKMATLGDDLNPEEEQVSLNKCPDCGAEVENPDFLFCIKCGAPL